MKKSLLLSVIASTMIMAGGDIALVEPKVEVEAPAPSGWAFNGQGVFYYQTQTLDLSYWGSGDYNFFDQESSFANAGVQLTAVNSDLFAGLGVGVQLNGLGTLGLDKDAVAYPLQAVNGNLNGAYISQLYLTYNIGNTQLKVGRQELPKELSPFAFSEDWSVFKNTFEAFLVINTDIPDTTLAGAWVRGANENGYSFWALDYSDFSGDMGDFHKLNNNDGIWMLTAQNKSLQNLTLTGSWYYADTFMGGDFNVFWLDAQYDAGLVNIGLQGGTVRHDAIDNTNAFGAKISANVVDDVKLCLAYSHVNDSTFGIFQIGGSSSALYTDMIAEEIFSLSQAVWRGYNFRNDNDKFVVGAHANIFNGKLSGKYGYTDFGNNDKTNEFDFTYSTLINEQLDLSITYAYIDSDFFDDSINSIRLVARYNF